MLLLGGMTLALFAIGGVHADPPVAKQSDHGVARARSSESRATKIAGYRAMFDRELVHNCAKLDAMAASGQGEEYYYFQSVLMGTLSMYESIGDRKYLDLVLNWAETMVSKATIIDKQGYRNWSGSYRSPYAAEPISFQLWDLQGSTELARLARIVLKDRALRPLYGKRAQAIGDFVGRDIVEKHLHRNDEWFMNNLKQTKFAADDKPMLFLRILCDLDQVRPEARRHQLLVDLAQAFRRRMERRQGYLTWDRGLGNEDHYTSVDTAHANRYPLAVIDLCRAEIVFTREDVQGLANLFAKVIWNQSVEDPRFANFIDGSNGTFRTRPGWNNGLIYSGWAALGEWDAQAQAACDAVFEMIQAGKDNPSVSYNGTLLGRLCLAGQLARNVAWRKY